ncbi:MAG: DUF11 domain-containing protein [Verrucomicrobiae bacterium]|nr:DUF11 domain-containing protein [Verrucomicrobiae bacterium]
MRRMLSSFVKAAVGGALWAGLAGVSLWGQSANLLVTMSGSPNALVLGGNVTYTMVVSNIGPNTASDVRLTNFLPAGFTFVSANASVSGAAMVTNAVMGFTNKLWRYNQNGQDLGTSWREVGYDDTSWPTGYGAFANESGYSNTWQVPTNTWLQLDANGSRILTYYFRTTFVVTNLLNNPSLFLRYQLDDGMVVYLNGVEIWRTNLPTGEITYSTGALSAHTENVLNSTNVAVTNLVAGTNLLAVEVHQQSATSSDIYFGMSVDLIGLSGAAATYQVQGSNVVFSVASLPAGGTMTATVVARAGTLGQNTVRATGGSSTADPAPGNNTATVVTLVNPPPSANLALTLTDFPDPIQVGNLLTYTLMVSNAGTIWATNTWLTNTLPSGVEFVSATISNAGLVTQYMTLVSFSNTWAYNQSNVALGVAWKEIAYDYSSWPVGEAVLAYETDPLPLPVLTQLNLTNELGRIPTYYFRSTFDYQGPPTNLLRLRLLVDDGAVVYLNGQEIYRTTNMPSGAIGFLTLATSAATEGVLVEPVVAVSNLLAGTNYLAVEVHQNSTNSSDVAFALQVEEARVSRGAYVVREPEVIFELGNLPAYNAAFIWLTVRPNQAGFITNYASVLAETYDNNLTNNSAWVSTRISATPVGADLSVTVTDTPDPVIQGQPLTYQITVRNAGPSAADNTRVTNVFYPGVQLVSLGPGCGIEGSAIVCDLGRVASNGQATATFVVRPNQVGVVSNVVVVGSDEVDANQTNNVAAAVTVVETSYRADLSLTMVDAPDPVIAGERFTNFLTVANAGLSNAPAVIVTNRWFGPAQVQAVRLPPGAVYQDLGGGVLVFHLGVVPVGSNVTVAVEALALSVGAVTNLASVSTPILDPNLANNSAVGSTRINPTPVVDLVTAVRTVPAVPYGGFPMLYELTVANAGTLNATGVIVTNWLPPEVTVVGVTNGHGTVTNTGNVWVFGLGSLPIGGSATVLVQVVTPPSGTLTNRAYAVSAQNDYNLSDNLAVLETVVVPGTAADIALQMTVTPSNAYAGQEVSLRLTVLNNGPQTATGIVITNWLPPQVQYLRGNVTAGSFMSSSNAQVIMVPSLANGASMNAVIVVKPLGNGGLLTNRTVAVTATADPTPNEVATVLRVAPAADVRVGVTAPTELVAAGSVVTYSVAAQNAGPSTASNATVFCYLPVGAQFQGAFPSQGSTAVSNGVVLWAVGNLAAGQTASLEVDFLPGGGTLAVGTVGITAPAYDPVTTNNTVTVITPILQGVGGGELVITPTTNINSLVAALTGGATGIQVKRAVLQAHRRGQRMTTGLFTSANIFGSGQALSGVALSTGNVADYGSGPNTDTGRTTAYGVQATEEQERLLDPITASEEESYTHYDVTQLDVYFEFLPGYDRVTFKVMFGSEEFPEYVESPWIDGFGIYLDGENIAFAGGMPVNIRHPAMKAVAGTELDGVIMIGETNPVMVFTAPVNPELTEHRLTFIVADTSDELLDTTVYVAGLGGSLGAVADVGISGTVAPDTALVGQPFTYTLQVTNAGPEVASNTVVRAMLPQAFSNLTLSVSTGTYTVAGGWLTWQVGHLARRGSAQATLRAVSTMEARLTLAFSVRSAMSDLNVSNNVVRLSSSAVMPGSYFNPAEIIIRDGAAALPYPSTIQVSGLTGVVDKVYVTLLDVHHTFPADIQALLVSPEGRQVLLMAGAGGGYDAEGLSLQFADDAPAALPLDQPLNTGAYRPGNLAPTNRFPGTGFIVQPQFATSLAALRRGNPNGNWSLFIYDSQGGDSGVIAGGWNLRIFTAPELSLAIAGSNLVISWHDLPGYTLEGTAALTANPQWVPVTATPVVREGRRVVTLPLSSGLKFFRLRQP